MEADIQPKRSPLIPADKVKSHINSPGEALSSPSPC